MTFKKYGSPWYFAIKGVLFLFISAMSFIQLPGTFNALGYVSFLIILSMSLIVFSNIFILKQKSEKIGVIFLACCHLTFAIIILSLTIKHGQQIEAISRNDFRGITFHWLTNWFAFFLLTEWVEVIHLWYRKNAHYLTIFVDSLMTAVFLIMFAFLEKHLTALPENVQYDEPFLFIAMISLLAGLGTIATSGLLAIGNRHSKKED